MIKKNPPSPPSLPVGGLPLAWRDLAWHVLRVDPQRERLVRDLLGEAGVPALVPMRRDVRAPTARQVARAVAAEAALSRGETMMGRAHRRARGRRPVGVQVEPRCVETVAAPGYVFAAVGGRWGLLRSSVGTGRHVRAVLCEDGRPAVVRVAVLEAMLARCAQASGLRATALRGLRAQDVTVGGSVRVAEGWLAGKVFEVAALQGSSAVELKTLFGGARVTVALDELMAA